MHCGGINKNKIKLSELTKINYLLILVWGRVWCGVKSYELTYIISPNLSSEKAGLKIKELKSFIQSKGGVLGFWENKAVAQTLSYPIKKQRSGYFTTLTFQVLENIIKEIKENLEKDQDVLRHLLVIKKPTKELKKRRTKKISATFQPQSDGKSSVFKIEEIKDSEKVDLDKIDKKLDEILSE